MQGGGDSQLKKIKDPKQKRFWQGTKQKKESEGNLTLTDLAKKTGVIFFFLKGEKTLRGGKRRRQKKDPNRGGPEINRDK